MAKGNKAPLPTSSRPTTRTQAAAQAKEKAAANSAAKSQASTSTRKKRKAPSTPASESDDPDVYRLSKRPTPAPSIHEPSEDENGVEDEDEGGEEEGGGHETDGVEVVCDVDQDMVRCFMLRTSC